MKSYARIIVEEYLRQNPDENDIDTRVKNNPGMSKKHFFLDLERVFWNWLDGLRNEPERALATTNWCGKVTKAFFAAHDVRTPRTKSEMITLAERLLRPLDLADLASMMRCEAQVSLASLNYRGHLSSGRITKIVVGRGRLPFGMPGEFEITLTFTDNSEETIIWSEK